MLSWNWYLAPTSPPLLRANCLCNCLHLTSVIEYVDASEEQPLAPVHLAELVVPPGDIQVRLGVCLERQRNQPLTRRLQCREHLLTCRSWWSGYNSVTDVGWPLAALNHQAGRLLLQSGYGADMPQHV